jgi:hypothetical protein
VTEGHPALDQARADLAVAQPSGFTPLVMAAQCGEDEAVEVLLSVRAT